MPPHCDSMDGPVVVAARKALEARDASIVLPYVPKEAQDEVREAFAPLPGPGELGPDPEPLGTERFEWLMRGASAPRPRPPAKRAIGSPMPSRAVRRRSCPKLAGCA
jgi:hypothetical protein